MKRTVLGVCSAAVLALAGCGDDTGTGGGAAGGGGTGGAAAETGYQSGTRLKVQVQRAGDADVYAGLFDSELASSCSVSPGTDGTLRCYPNGNTTVLYADAACATPVAQFFPGGCVAGPSTFTTETTYGTPDACGVTSYAARAFTLGAKLSPAPATLFVKNGDSCVEQGPGGEVYALTTVDDASLVEIQVGDEPRGDALTAQVYASADGLRVLGFNGHDVARDVDCNPAPFSDRDRCQPLGDAFAIQPGWADAACTTPLENGFGIWTDGCPLPDRVLVVNNAPGDCSGTVAMHELGAPLAESYFTDTCQPYGATTYAVGAKIPDSEFAPVDKVDVGTGGVVARHYEAGGQPLTMPLQFFNADGTFCFPYKLADGSLRCGPPTLAYVPGPGGARYWADAACSQLLVQIADQGCDSAADITYVVVTPSNEACAGYEMHALGAEHTGSLFIGSGASDCVPDQPLQGYVYHQVGAVVPSSQFVEVELVTL